MEAWMIHHKGNLKRTFATVHQYGWQNCSSGHSYGPAVRDHFLIHFIVSGKGIFEVDGECFELSAGEGFLIFPGVTTFYHANLKNPWKYYWIGFSGEDFWDILKRKGLEVKKPVLDVSPDRVSDCFERLVQRGEEGEHNRLAQLSCLYELLSYISDNASIRQSSGYIDEAIHYIAKNYSYDISVSSIAKEICLNRSHFYRIFKKSLGISPEEFVRNYRLEKAKELLESSDLSVSAVACSCGMPNLSHFSSAYKKRFGISPKSSQRARQKE